MKLSELSPPKGAVTKSRRIGRGNATGQGGTAGKGHKGAKARAGTEKGPGFEGGQMPLIRRVPKRGFKNPNSKFFAVVNVGQLSRFEAGSVVDPDILRKQKLIRKKCDGLKILSEGDLNVSLTVVAHKFSAKAKEKILAAGGTVETIKD